jgi:hypothetical protein
VRVVLVRMCSPGAGAYTTADSFGRSAVFTSAPTPRFGSSPRERPVKSDTPGPVYEYGGSLGGQVSSGHKTAPTTKFGSAPRDGTKPSDRCVHRTLWFCDR